jgi:hypothetical protein
VAHRRGPTSQPPDVQLDLFGEVTSTLDDLDRRALIRADFEANQYLDCCTGKPCPPGNRTRPIRDDHGHGHAVIIDGVAALEDDPDGWYPQVRCGRCGQYTFPYGMVINHDRGYAGCPVAEDRPALQYLPADRARAWQQRRHDRLHHADCTCGHPWGFHDHTSAETWLQPRGRCGQHCGCATYIAGSTPPPAPSRWGPAWTPPADLLPRH